MYVEITNELPAYAGKAMFAIHELTVNELELLQEGLVELKNNKLKDAEAFKDDRRACVEMFNKIDAELVRAKS